MVVLRGDDDQSICLAHLGGKVGVLDGLSRIVGGQWKLCDIDEVGLDARALAQFPGYKASCVQAHTPHSGGTENHRDEHWPTCFHKPAPLLRPDCINGPSEDSSQRRAFPNAYADFLIAALWNYMILPRSPSRPRSLF